MSLTLIIWLSLFAILTALAFMRPAYGVALYMLTFFLCPPFWWWGDAIASHRWNLYAGVVLLLSVAMSLANDPAQRERLASPMSRRICVASLFMLLNAVVVHLSFANDIAIGIDSLILLAKFVLLFFLIFLSITCKWDLRIILISIVLGAGYLGYEVTINDRGNIVGNRLEGVGVPAASTANGLACMLVTVLPISGALFLIGSKWEKLLMLPVAPMILNTILLCNSRGAFLALIFTALVFLVKSPPSIRNKVLKLLCLAAVAAWLLLGDPRIIERFLTTFSSGQERDSSAASRLVYWSAAIEMIGDYPLGAGGDGFKKVHGSRYLLKRGIDEPSRSIHNGFLSEACQWGIQGLALRLWFLICALRLLWHTGRASAHMDADFYAITSLAISAGIVGMMFQSIFGTFLDHEWSFWMVALAVAVSQLHASEAEQSPTDSTINAPPQELCVSTGHLR